MKKIAFLINSLGKGGAEHVAVNLAEHFCTQGYEVLFVTSRILPEEYELSFPNKRRILEEEISGAPFGRIGKIPARITGLKKIWREEKPDIILSFIGKLNLYAMLSAGRSGIPVFLSVRSDPAREYPGIFQKWLAGKLFAKARGVFFQTDMAMLFFGDNVRCHSEVLPNLLDESFLKPRYEGKRDDEIVMVGRLDANKNHAMVFRAFAALYRDFPDYRLVIYGAGLEDGSDTQPALLKLAAELGISERVIFKGRQSHIREKIERARIFVLASGYEGMPNALLEAMASGLCVISTDCPCGGPATVIRDRENGILIPVGDEQALKQALREVMADETFAERLGTAAAGIADILSSDKVCEQWQRAIESRL